MRDILLNNAAEAVTHNCHTFSDTIDCFLEAILDQMIKLGHKIPVYPQ